SGYLWESQTGPTAGAARLRSAAHMSQTAVIMGLTTAGRGHQELPWARWRDSSLVMSAVWLAGGGVKWTGAPKPVKIIVAPALPLPGPPGAAAGTGAWNRICRIRWWASIHPSTGNEAMLRALISLRTSWASLAPSVACTLAATLSRLTCARYSVAGAPATVAWPAWDTPLETANRCHRAQVGSPAQARGDDLEALPGRTWSRSMLTHALGRGICLRAAADTRMYSARAAPSPTRTLMAPGGATAPFPTSLSLVFSANELAAKSPRPDPVT